MAESSLVRKSRLWTQNVKVRLARGYAWFVLVLLALSAVIIVPRLNGPLALTLLSLEGVAALLPTVAVALTMPVPQPLAERSLFMARITWFGRASRGALFFALAALYGGQVGADISSPSQQEHFSAFLTKTIWEPVQVVLELGGAMVLLWLWVDLARAGTAMRKVAAAKVVAWIIDERPKSSHLVLGPSSRGSFLYMLLFESTKPLTAAVSGACALIALAGGLGSLRP